MPTYAPTSNEISVSLTEAPTPISPEILIMLVGIGGSLALLIGILIFGKKR